MKTSHLGLVAAGLLLLAPRRSSARRRSSTSRLTTVPVVAKRSSGYGWRIHPVKKVRKFHKGLDMAAKTGTPVVAAGDGVVEFAGVNGGYGNLIRLDHGGGLTTRYGHLSKILVKKGQQVTAGERIGLVGSTGMSTGAHLHFEVRQNGQPMNPAEALPAIDEKPN